MSVPTPFSLYLGRALSAKGWSQRELARRLGCSPSSVRRWLSGRAVPGPAFIVLLGRVLGLNGFDMLDLLALTEVSDGS